MGDDSSTAGRGLPSHLKKVTLGYCPVERRIFLHALTSAGETISIWLKISLATKLTTYLQMNTPHQQLACINEAKTDTWDSDSLPDQPVQISPYSAVCLVDSIDVTVTDTLTTLTFDSVELGVRYSLALSNNDLGV